MSNALIKYNLGLKADYEGILDFVIPKTTIGFSDFTIPYIKWISGIQLILDKQELGDKVWFQIIGNVQHGTYGLLPDTVLEEFGEGWFVDPDNRAQQILIPDNVQSELNPNNESNTIDTYGSYVIKNTLRIRVKYQSVGSINDVRCLVNVIFDKK